MIPLPTVLAPWSSHTDFLPFSISLVGAREGNRRNFMVAARGRGDHGGQAPGGGRSEVGDRVPGRGGKAVGW